MDAGDFASLRFVTSSIYGLHRRLPYDFTSDCGRVFTVALSANLDFVCPCGINNHLVYLEDAPELAQTAPCG